MLLNTLIIDIIICAFSALTLSVGQWDWHPHCKNCCPKTPRDGG